MHTKKDASKKARLHDPWSCRLPKSHLDVSKLSSSFESTCSAKAERNLRLRHLQQRNSDQHWLLARKLQSCAAGTRCLSAACPICYRRFRRWFIGGVLEIFADSPDIILTTLIPAEQAVATHALQNFLPTRLGNMLRQQLRRTGMQSEIVVGGIDGDYDEVHELWQPHFHLIAPAKLASQISGLRERFYPKSDRVYRPVHIQPVNDRAEQISYCVKSYWPKKVRYLDDRGGKRTAQRRLDEPLHTDWLLWRDRFASMDFAFMHGVRRYGDKLRPSAPRK